MGDLPCWCSPPLFRLRNARFSASSRTAKALTIQKRAYGLKVAVCMASSTDAACRGRMWMVWGEDVRGEDARRAPVSTTASSSGESGGVGGGDSGASAGMSVCGSPPTSSPVCRFSRGGGGEGRLKAVGWDGTSCSPCAFGSAAACTRRSGMMVVFPATAAACASGREAYSQAHMAERGREREKCRRQSLRLAQEQAHSTDSRSLSVAGYASQAAQNRPAGGCWAAGEGLSPCGTQFPAVSSKQRAKGMGEGRGGGR